MGKNFGNNTLLKVENYNKEVVVQFVVSYLGKLLGKKETGKQKPQSCSVTGLEKTNVLGQIICIPYTKLLKASERLSFLLQCKRHSTTCSRFSRNTCSCFKSTLNVFHCIYIL